MFRSKKKKSKTSTSDPLAWRPSKNGTKKKSTRPIELTNFATDPQDADHQFNLPWPKQPKQGTLAATRRDLEYGHTARNREILQQQSAQRGHVPSMLKLALAYTKGSRIWDGGDERREATNLLRQIQNKAMAGDHIATNELERLDQAADNGDEDARALLQYAHEERELLRQRREKVQSFYKVVKARSKAREKRPKSATKTGNKTQKSPKRGGTKRHKSRRHKSRRRKSRRRKSRRRKSRRRKSRRR